MESIWPVEVLSDLSRFCLIGGNLCVESGSRKNGNCTVAFSYNAGSELPLLGYNQFCNISDPGN